MVNLGFTLSSEGFGPVYVHQVGPDQEGCIRFYEREILPHLTSKAA
jgi:hypothetical protein